MDSQKKAGLVALLNAMAGQELGHKPRPRQVYVGVWACGHDCILRNKAFIKKVAKLVCPKCKREGNSITVIR